MAVEQQYYAEHLGVVGEPQYRLIGNFFEANGLVRVSSRLPYLNSVVATQENLVPLEAFIRRKLGDDQFVRSYRSYEELGLPYSFMWSGFQGAVSEILCEQYVQSSEVSPEQRLITNQQLIETLMLMRDSGRYRFGLTETFSLQQDGYFGACPDSLLLSIFGEEALVERLYEYKSVLDGADIHKPDGNAILNIKQPFKEGTFTRPLLTDAIGQLADIEPANILVPDSKDLPARLVASEKGITVIEAAYLKTEFDGGAVCLDVPSIRSFAYFILKIMTGEVRERSHWMDYFTPVATSLARDLNMLRASSTKRSKAEMQTYQRRIDRIT